MTVLECTMKLFILFTICLTGGNALYCYRCTSSQAGCGEQIDILLQKWKLCPSDNGPAMCVKMTEKSGTTTKITRDCLSNLRLNTEYREDLPTVRRHNYCNPGRNTPEAQRFSDGSGGVPDENDKRIYCFCNDWNGCNPASSFSARPLVALLLSLVSLLAARCL